MADDGGDFGAEEFDGVEDLFVGHGAEAELEEEAVVVEELVLVEDFFDDLVGGADEVGTLEGDGLFHLGAGDGGPATFLADVVHHGLEVGDGFVLGLLVGSGEVAVGVDANGEGGGVVAGEGGGVAVELDEGGELGGLAADDGDGEGEAEVSGAGDGLGGAADGDPDREGVLVGAGVDALAGEGGTVATFPVDMFVFTNLEEEFEFFGEEGVVIAEVVAEEGERFGEGAAAGHDFGTAMAEEVEGGEVLEDANGVIGTEDGDGTAEADVLGAGGGGGEDGGGGGGDEIGAVVFAEGEDVEADFVGEFDGFEEVIEALVGGDELAGVGVWGTFGEGVEADFERFFGHGLFS